MTNLSVSEWGKIVVGKPGGFTVREAEALVNAAKAHPLGGDEGTGILADHRHFLRARQMVGVIAAPGCSLEILPKVDPESPPEDAPSVRRRLVALLDLALGLNLGEGSTTNMAHGAESLLDILIRIFAERLLAETRRGLPRLYLACEDDLPALRGRLDVERQFTVNAVRPDRLSCRYDVLSHDIPLLQVMAATVVFLRKHARSHGIRRLLDELRFVLADVTLLPPSILPWSKVRIDRSNRRWESLFRLAELLLKRNWQSTYHDPNAREGVTLLFPMEKLFEDAVAVLLRRALAGTGLEVVAQGGLRRCIGDWADGEDCVGRHFQTIPDIQLKREGKTVAVIDTKWKCLASNPLDAKRGINQSDIYQMMAYARLYDCERLMLLYPATLGSPTAPPHFFGIHGGREMLAVGRVDVASDPTTIQLALRKLIGALKPWHEN